MEIAASPHLTPNFHDLDIFTSAFRLIAIYDRFVLCGQVSHHSINTNESTDISRHLHTALRPATL